MAAVTLCLAVAYLDRVLGRDAWGVLFAVWVSERAHLAPHEALRCQELYRGHSLGPCDGGHLCSSAPGGLGCSVRPSLQPGAAW